MAEAKKGHSSAQSAGQAAPAGTASAAPTDNGKKAPQLSKRERFVKYAPRRVTRAVKALRAVGNLAAKGSYEYSEKEAANVVRILGDALAAVRIRFQGQAPAAEVFSPVES